MDLETMRKNLRKGADVKTGLKWAEVKPGDKITILPAAVPAVEDLEIAYEDENTEGVLKTWTLRFQKAKGLKGTGGTDKVYVIQLIQIDEGDGELSYMVRARHGRFGATLQSTNVHGSGLTKFKAEQLARKTVGEKRKYGYKLVSDDTTDY